MSLEEWQGSLDEGDFVFGADTDYEGSGPIGGLGNPKPRGTDQPRGSFDGDAGGRDTLPKRILTFPLNLDAPTAGGVWSLRSPLLVAFRESKTDRTLDLRLPGFPTDLRYFGRARGVDLDLKDLKSGHGDAQAIFEALDPFAYGPEVELEDLTDAFTVANAGDSATDRVVATITGDGGIPRLDNTTTGGFVVFNVALPADEIAVIDFRSRTMVNEAGVDRLGRLEVASPWLRLEPGDNDLELAGASSVSITLRPAYR